MQVKSDLNRAIEIHDSVLITLVREDRSVHVELDAYVHESAGEPGGDEGAGFRQCVRIVLSEAKTTGGEHLALPCELWDGFLAVGVDPALTISGPFGTPSIAGHAVRVDPIGPATFVERFPGTTST